MAQAAKSGRFALHSHTETNLRHLTLGSLLQKLLSNRPEATSSVLGMRPAETFVQEMDRNRMEMESQRVKGGRLMMTEPTAAKSVVPTTLLKVGLEVFPVYGDESSGFSMDADDLAPTVSRQFRYRSIDELFFALVNLNCAEEGTA